MTYNELATSKEHLMKKIILIFIIFCSCQSDKISLKDINVVDEIAYFKYDMSLVNGLVVDYFDNGKLKYECNFINGKRDGIFRKWHSPEIIFLEREYKKGIQTGISKSWYSNGQLFFEVNYKDGKKNGNWKSWYENGQVWDIGEYKNGRETGVWKVWDNNGKFMYEERK